MLGVLLIYAAGNGKLSKPNITDQILLCQPANRSNTNHANKFPKMNILILSNGAPSYHIFFNALSKEFKKCNHNILYAVDCNTSVEENGLKLTGFPYKIFSDYFAQHRTNNELLAKYGKYNISSALLSDYERAVEYKIWGRRDNYFYEKLKSALLSYFERIILENGIDAVIYENVSNSFSHFCWFVCKEHSVKYVGLTSSRLPGRFWITDDPLGEYKIIEKTFREIDTGALKIQDEVRAWAVGYIENIENISPDYMKFNGLDNIGIFKKYFRREKASKLIVVFRHILDDHYHSYQRGNPLLLSLNFLFRSLKRRLKSSFIKTYYDTEKEGENFILYPLHFHPESSTSILCGTYLNEFEVIQNIAFNLPQGLKLYVKDHISAFGYPSISFYRKISSLPNVRLLAPQSPTKQLINKSKAVITLTSTVGYEALLLNKPVYLFGSVFYEKHKNIIKVGDPRNLYELLSAIPLISDNTADLKEYNIRFVSAYYLNTLDGTLNLSLNAAHCVDLVEKTCSEILKTVHRNKSIHNYQ